MQYVTYSGFALYRSEWICIRLKPSIPPSSRQTRSHQVFQSLGSQVPTAQEPHSLADTAGVCCHRPTRSSLGPTRRPARPSAASGQWLPSAWRATWPRCTLACWRLLPRPPPEAQASRTFPPITMLCSGVWGCESWRCVGLKGSHHWDVPQLSAQSVAPSLSRRSRPQSLCSILSPYRM